MRRLTADEPRQDEAVISGKYVAWTGKGRLAVAQEEKDPENTRVTYADDIYLLNLETDELRRITDVPEERRNLDIDGHRLVWQDNRNEIEEHETHFDIYAYDIEMDLEIPIEVAPGAQRWPVIYGDSVIWADNRNSPRMGTRKAGCGGCPEVLVDIHLYDFATGERKMIVQSEAANSRSSDIHGDYIEQTWTKMAVRLNAAESRSWSVTASVLTNAPEGLVLTYLFDNEPEVETVRTMQRFRGTAILVSDTPGRLDGHYYTSRGRETYGSLKLSRGLPSE